MDYPRNERELQQERRLLLLRTAIPPTAALLIIFVLIVLIRSGSGSRGDIPPLPPRSPLPDGIWSARIEEWAEAADPLNSLIIAHEDTILAERYFRGMTSDRQVNVKSASKSVMSALVGIALEEGYLEDVDQRIAEFLPTYLNGGSDPRKTGITIGHLLSMSSGLEGTSFNNYDAWIASSDWIGHVLDRPLLADPGSRMIYSTGNTHLLSVILTEASGMNTLSFSRRHLFQPLGISIRAWDRDPNGYYMGGNNMHLSPREMLRFGQLYLNGGRYGERQIMSESWVEHTMTPAIRWGYRWSGYGYGWWFRRMRGHDVWYASGYGGQYIFVVPSLDLVVVTTCSLAPGRRRRPPVVGTLERMIIPAILDRILRRELALWDLITV